MGNFSAKSGQSFQECGKTKVKNKVPRKSAGLLPENGGRNRHFHWKTREISLKRQIGKYKFRAIQCTFLNDGVVFHVFNVVPGHSVLNIHGFHDGMCQFRHG